MHRIKRCGGDNYFEGSDKRDNMHSHRGGGVFLHDLFREVIGRTSDDAEGVFQKRFRADHCGSGIAYKKGNVCYKERIWNGYPVQMPVWNDGAYSQFLCYRQAGSGGFQYAQ